MTGLASRFFLVLSVLILVVLMAALTANATDSTQEMLAAGRADDVIAALNAHLASTPADAESFNLLCRSYFALEDWERAVASCKRAASLDPNNSRFHLWMGRAYGEKAARANFLSAMSLAGKVRGEFERAVQLNPKDVDARLDLAEYYLEAPGIVGGGEQKARAQAQSIGAMDPAREHWVYARIAEKKKDASSAEREYHQYIDLSKGDAEAWLNLALFLHRQKRIDEMEQAIVKLSHAPTPKLNVLADAAAILYRAGRNFSLATELLRRYFAAGPVEAAPAFKARNLLGTLLEKQGDKAGATQEYRTALSLARNFGPAQQALNRVTHTH